MTATAKTMVQYVSENQAIDAAEEAKPVVSVDVALVVVAEQHLSADAAVDRLAALQEQERAIDKEKKPLREGVEHALRRAGLQTFSTASGHSATLYEQERAEVDKEYLKSVLTPEQFERAFRKKAITGMRIR